MWRRKTVLQKVQFSLVGLVAGVLVIGVSSLMGLQAATERADAVMDGNRQRAVLIDDLRTAVADRAVGIRNSLLQAVAQGRGQDSRAAVEAHARVQAAIAAVRRLAEMPDTPAPVVDAAQRLVQIEHRYAAIALDLVQRIQQGETHLALERLQQGCQPALLELASAMATFKSASDAMEADQVAQAETANQRQRLTTLALISLAVAGAVVGAWSVRHSIFRSLGAEPETLRAVARQIAEGDLAVSLDLSRASPHSVMAAYGEMTVKLGQLVRRVREASHEIALGSAELSVGNSSLSQRTDTQASSLQQTAASMMEMARAVQASAQTAAHATQLASQAHQSAAQGRTVVQEVVGSMQRISHDAARVHDIIAVIDGLAFQTNMLALNAAVEAARAGENGRGFAVVAGEVRALAKRSADAAREIQALIEHSTGEVQRGVGFAAAAGQAIDGLVSQVQSVSDLLAQASRGAEAQSQGIREINGAMSQLDDVTQQNAALVEESTAATESLSHQAAALDRLVGAFRVA